MVTDFRNDIYAFKVINERSNNPTYACFVVQVDLTYGTKATIKSIVFEKILTIFKFISQEVDQEQALYICEHLEQLGFIHYEGEEYKC